MGSIRITALSVGTVPLDTHTILLGTTTQNTDDLLKDSLQVNPVEVSINAYLFKEDKRVVLVDTGAGEFFGPGYGGRLLASLAAAGVQPSQVTDILLTHAHDDHMGGLVHGGKIVFPNATVHIGKPDIDFFLDRSNAAKSHYAVSYFEQAVTALKPYLDAGKIKTFDGTTLIMPGVTAVVHPGHTPGSAFYTLESDGQKIIFVGDIAHVVAAQFPEPSITVTYDVNPELAAQVRKQAFAAFARDHTLIAVPHIPFPGVGYVRAVATGYDWVPIEFGDRPAK